ncbi:hypothetical protein CBFG_00253 [Clostridiales bacterium 1_7_47FAA]|nr:hypothetical protein CBFG_00253 [Clostridiales bacterium 1_7_47FAA]
MDCGYCADGCVLQEDCYREVLYPVVVGIICFCPVIFSRASTAYQDRSGNVKLL